MVRKIALRFAEGSTEPVVVRPEGLPDMLGPEIFNQETMRRDVPPGVATGLAWTETGGDVLYIEGTLLPDGKGMTLTGQLGEVMQESAKAAQSYIWSHAEDFGIDPAVFKNTGVHIHVPAGAIPKDGPSAGVTMATALTSLYTKLPARNDTAMTGEITLTGLCCRSAASRRRRWRRGARVSTASSCPERTKKTCGSFPRKSGAKWNSSSRTGWKMC